MEIDFHFGVTYLVGRIAGFSHEEAEIVATCSQYVDDTVNRGALKFKTGESFYRISSSHKRTDLRLYVSTSERQVWVPFHFIPGNDPSGPHDEEFYNRMICRANSSVAQAVLAACIANKSRPFALHEVGVASHAFLDTWAHQGFAGIHHPSNRVRKIRLVGDTRARSMMRQLKGFFLAFEVKRFFRFLSKLFSSELLNFSFPMGHGAALHYPDQPFRRWSYVNGFGHTVHRDNPKDFLVAIDELCKFYQRFIAGDPAAHAPGIPREDKARIAELMGAFDDEDGHARLRSWIGAMKRGEFSFGPAEPRYFKDGPDSWKFSAYGGTRERVWPWERFEYRPEFLTSNWKLFHDALETYQTEVINEILPRFGICAI